MGLLSKLVGIDIGSVADGVMKAVDSLTESPDEKRAFEVLKLKIEQEQAKWQAEVNKIQASNRSLFIAGARPAMMWVMVLAMGMNYLVNPMLAWITTLCGSPMTGPQLDMGTLMPIILGTLGLGTLRTVEKSKGLTQ